MASCDGGKDRTNRIPPHIIDTAFDRVNIQAVFRYPIRKALDFVANGNETIATGISKLLGAGRPATIRFRVVAIVIDALNRSILNAKLLNVFKEAGIHIVSKGIKRLPFALNTTFTISGILRRFRIVTPCTNTVVYLLKSATTQTVSPRSYALKSRLNDMAAATTFGIPADYSATPAHVGFAARAKEFIDKMTTWILPQELHKGKLIKSFTDYATFHTS